MKLKLICVGKRLPGWVNQGVDDYLKRLPAEYQVQLIEIAAVKRNKNTDLNKAMNKEADALLAAVPKQNHVVVLERTGEQINTQQLANKLQHWQHDGIGISLLIGGPEGLTPDVCQQAHWQWSLSALTLPHPLARIMVAEQIYRAWSIINRHPYHR